MKSLIISFAFLLITALSYGQSYTIYEKKCYSLTVEFLKNLGVANSDINNIKSVNQLAELMIRTLFQKKADRINVSREIYSYERKMKEAEKLKTDVDFKKKKKEKDLEEAKRKAEKLEQDEKTEKEKSILKKKEVQEEVLRIERQKMDSINNSDYAKKEKVFYKVETEAVFNGGQRAWTNYLKNNLNFKLIKDNGAPLDSYTVVIRFIVNLDGSIEKLFAETNIGYGMEQEVIRVLKESPPWIPAQQNGHAVRAYRSQPVGFRIE